MWRFAPVANGIFILLGIGALLEAEDLVEVIFASVYVEAGVSTLIVVFGRSFGVRPHAGQLIALVAGISGITNAVVLSLGIAGVVLVSLDVKLTVVATTSVLASLFNLVSLVRCRSWIVEMARGQEVDIREVGRSK